MKKLILTALLIFGSHQAMAAEADVYCQTGTSSTGFPNFLPASSTNPCPVTIAGGGGGPVTIADGADVTLGAKADAKSTATDTTPITIMSVVKQISASVQAMATSLAGFISSNLAQVNGVTVLTGTGATGTGAQRVTVSQDTATIAGAAPGTQAAPSTNVISTQGVSRVVVTLDIKTVTTGGTAVNALSAGNAAEGGWLQNPKAATIDLCINQIGAAVGTVSSGDTTCVTPGNAYQLIPSANAVSVISSDSAHPFSGYGIK